jgi:hypothetical protein
VQSIPFSKLNMIPQKLDNFHKQFGHNKIGGLWLSATVVVQCVQDSGSNGKLHAQAQAGAAGFQLKV